MIGRRSTSPLAASCGLSIIFALAMTICVAAQSTATDRAAAIEQQITDRARLIEDNPRDPALLADQAADYYFEFLAIEASGWTTLLGVPNAAQRERALRAGREIYALARRAETAIEETIFNLEASPGYADSLDLQRERRRLVEEERDRRIPFLIGVGASVRVHAGDLTGESKRALLTTALDTLKAVAPRLGGPVAAHAQVHAGIAAAELARVDEAMRFLDEAESNDDGDPLVTFAARLALASLDNAQAQRNLDRLAANPDYARSMFHRLLIADRLFAVRKPQSLKNAASAYTALLDAPLGLPRETVREIILARLANAVVDVPEAERPPFAVIAIAERFVREGEPDASVIASIDRLIERTDLTGLERTHAILTLARLHHRKGEYLTAASIYIRLAREHPRQPEAERAIEIGLALAADRYRAEPAAARDVLHNGLLLALESYPRLPNIDRWRFVAGRLALNESRYDEAIARFDAVSASHELFIDGRALRIEALRRAVASAEDAQRRSALLDELIESIESLSSQLTDAAAHAEPDREVGLRRHSLQIRVHRASALTAIGEPERAVELLAGIEAEEGVDGPLLAEALQARIEALQALGRIDAAQGQIDRFVAQATAVQVKAVLGPMLASIERRVNALRTGGRAGQARDVAMLELAPLAARLDTWMNEDEQRFDAALALRIADAHRLAGQYEAALRLYEQLLAGNPNALPLLLGRAECLYHLGVASRSESLLADAMTIYRRLIAAGADMHDVYWRSQLRSLQILDAIDRNTHQIAPQIQRLRLRDPGLGGDEFRQEFERLQNKYAN